MNEEGESPSGSQTANKDKKKNSFPTKVIHKVGLEKRSVADKLENEVKLLQSRISQLEEEAKNTEIMIRAKFTDVSKLTEEKVYSQPTEHAGVTWKMSVHKYSDNDIEFHLHGEKKNEVRWLCPVISQFLLFSQKSKEIVHRCERKMSYHANHSIDYLENISYTDLFAEEKGFVKDDSILVAVSIRAHPRIIHEFPETTIHSKFTDISKLTEDFVYSHNQPTEHAGVTWRMSMYNSFNRFWFHLEGVKENEVEWFCPVIAEFLLCSQKSKELIHRWEKKMIYGTKEWMQCIKYISREYLFDEEKGFVKDDSIIVAVALRSFPRSMHQIPEMTIDAKLTEISKLNWDGIYSKPTEVAGVTWKINVCKVLCFDLIGFDLRGDIKFNLEGEKKNAVGWWCAVIVQFQLISQKSREIVRRCERNLIYDAENSSNELLEILRKDLFNEDNGFVDDDSIIVAVTIRGIPTD